jgi:hypothetical protein
VWCDPHNGVQAVDFVLHPGWLLVGLSGIAGLVFLVLSGRESARQKRHGERPRRV